VPSTTQPPFRLLIIKLLEPDVRSFLDLFILLFHTGGVKSPTKTAKRWQKSGVNLYRYVPTDTYYAKVRVKGKLYEKCLKTEKAAVALLLLKDYESHLRKNAENLDNATRGKMTVGNAVEILKTRLEGDRRLKPRSKEYRLERLGALTRSWSDFEKQEISKISRRDCDEWQRRFGATASPTAFNNTVGTLRMILDIAVEYGARYDNPAKGIQKHRIRLSSPQLPSKTQFHDLVNAIESFRLGRAKRSANLVRFLAYGGFRKSEAARITWADCDFERGIIHVKGDPETGTKNWEVRQVPMIPKMQELLRKLREESPNAKGTDSVMLVKECQGALTRGCKAIGINRITHHDLRHLFATICIESGRAIPTVAHWLGHKDGGALLMKVYSHLRQEYSVEMAQGVNF
jgi:integrase